MTDRLMDDGELLPERGLTCDRCGGNHAPDASIKVRGLYDCHGDAERKALTDAVTRALRQAADDDSTAQSGEKGTAK